MSEPPFHVLLGPDGAGKSSVLSRLAERLPEWRAVSTDDAFVPPEHRLVSRLRRDVVHDVLPGLGPSYSVDFLASLLQTAVVYLKDRIQSQPPTQPLLVDSYYYKILAKCRLAGIDANPMYTWWRGFPQPRSVIYLAVSPATAWRRTQRPEGLNTLEHFGDSPVWASFESYQRSLHKLMLEEVRGLPVTIVEERPGVERTVDAVLEAISE
ncbi:hypothetical protein [Streptomyces sulphureus]|uniref:hypothetical protein n=1 Tax=Streptomyces sulphureus TaxID=47758 RepID=UPI0003A97103|nr:hypothetical protein [Streptomyces sulphureus]